MKVENFYNLNQFRLYGKGENNLQSYNSLVVITKWDEQGRDIIILGRDWDYSRTTSKHVYMFLEEYTKINFYGVANKRQYINKLIDRCNENEEQFYNENGYIIKYDENVR